MKRNVLLNIIILLSLNSLYGQIVIEGNIAKYYFNESNANDEIGTNNGIIFGAIPSVDRFENEEHAFRFNSSFIRIDHNDTLDFGTNEFSISAWFKTENNDSYGVIFNKGEGSATKPRVFIRTMQSPQNTLQWRVGDGVFSVTGTHTDPSLFDNKWHHVVLVRSTNSLSLYVDATLVNFTAHNQLPIINTNSDRPILIGVQDSILSSNVPFGNYFDGQLDDYRIYNRVINELEVDSLFNEANPVIMTKTQELLKSNAFFISPNPTHNEIRVDLKSTVTKKPTFEIFNSLGMPIKTGTLEDTTIDLSFLTEGIYYLRLSDEAGIIGLKRFVKLGD